VAQTDDLDEILAWREERTVTRNLTLHYDRMMLLLDPTSLARGLVRKKVEVVNYPDGRFAVRFNGAALGFKVFDKIQTVLRPAHSRGHQFVTRYPKASDISPPPCLLRLLPAGANRRVGLAPTGKRRLVTAHPHTCHSR
jgi:hypothetical protein